MGNKTSNINIEIDDESQSLTSEITNMNIYDDELEYSQYSRYSQYSAQKNTKDLMELDSVQIKKLKLPNTIDTIIQHKIDQDIKIIKILNTFKTICCSEKMKENLKYEICHPNDKYPKICNIFWITTHCTILTFKKMEKNNYDLDIVIRPSDSIYQKYQKYKEKKKCKKIYGKIRFVMIMDKFPNNLDDKIIAQIKEDTNIKLLISTYCEVCNDYLLDEIHVCDPDTEFVGRPCWCTNICDIFFAINKKIYSIIIRPKLNYMNEILGKEDK